MTMHQNQASQLSFDLLTASLKPPKSRRTDPVTSYLAAKVAKRNQTADHCLILGALRQGPAIVDRLAEITGRPAHALGKRVSELADAKPPAIKLTGRKLKGASGSPQREWELA